MRESKQKGRKQKAAGMSRKSIFALDLQALEEGRQTIVATIIKNVRALRTA